MAKKKPKKEYKKEPSLRIKNVFKKVLESRGKISLGQAMREEGYPSTTAKNPQQMTSTKSWQQLLQQYIPDEDLIQAQSQLLNAFRLGHQVFPLSIKDEDIIRLLDSTNCTVVSIKYGEQGKHVYFWSPDNLARDRALDKAFKLTGKYTPTRFKFEDENEEFTEEQLKEEIARRQKLRELGKEPDNKRKKKSS